MSTGATIAKCHQSWYSMTGASRTPAMKIRKYRLVVVAIALLACAAGSLLLLDWLGCVLMSTQSMTAAIQERGGVIAKEARIIRQSPEGRGGIFKNNTLELVDPIVIKSIHNADHQSFLIIPDGPWVAGAVDVAKATMTELNLPEELDAILASNVCIFKMNTEGKFIYMQSGMINYLRVSYSKDGVGTKSRELALHDQAGMEH
jgi:hypothetical protein